jgi:tetratricopeptide (TPR) repeat protein
MVAACGWSELETFVERQLADYPVSPTEALHLRSIAAFCDGDYVSRSLLGIEASRIDRNPRTPLESLIFLASLGYENALRQLGAAQRIMRSEFYTDNSILPDPSYFTAILPERLQSWSRSMNAGFGDQEQYAIALMLNGEYEQAEKLIDSRIRMWDGFYQGMGMFWHADTLRVHAFKSWFLARRGEEEEAAELAGELLAFSREAEATRWEHSHGKTGDLPLMILVLNNETQMALDWLAEAEQAGWLGFQPLLTSPVYAEFRQIPEVALALERIVDWRAGVLAEILALGLPEIENPGLLVDYMAALARPTHRELALVALHFDDDPVGALGHYEKALREDPDNTRIISQAAELAIEFALVDEAVRLSERAVSLAPDSPSEHYLLSISYGHARRWQEAIASARRAIELAPDQGGVQRWLGQMLLLDNDPVAAEEVFLGIEDEFGRTMGMIMAHHALGRQAESDDLLQRWLETNNWRTSPIKVAYVHAFRGESDDAFAWLEKATASPVLLRDLATFPMLLNLHDDPRWLPFLESIGKSPEQLAGIEFSVNLPRSDRK